MPFSIAHLAIVDYFASGIFSYALLFLSVDLLWVFIELPTSYTTFSAVEDKTTFWTFGRFCFGAKVGSN